MRILYANSSYQGSLLAPLTLGYSKQISLAPALFGHINIFKLLSQLLPFLTIAVVNIEMLAWTDIQSLTKNIIANREGGGGVLCLSQS